MRATPSGRLEQQTERPPRLVLDETKFLSAIALRTAEGPIPGLAGSFIFGFPTTKPQLENLAELFV